MVARSKCDQRIAAHESPARRKLYDRTTEQVSG
jgi:hypothetical protein